jgi:hypothetical protein
LSFSQNDAIFPDTGEPAGFLGGPIIEMAANPLPSQLTRLQLAIERNREILDSGTFFQRKAKEMSQRGFKFLARASLPDRSGCQPAEIVLREFDSGYHRFVTHQHNINNGENDGYYWGHYFDNESEARKDFHERCKRNGI